MKIVKFVFLSLILANSNIHAAAGTMRQEQNIHIAQGLLTRLVSSLQKESHLTDYHIMRLSESLRAELPTDHDQSFEIACQFSDLAEDLLRTNKIDYVDFHKISKAGIMTYKFLTFINSEFDKLLKLTCDTLKATDLETYIAIAPHLWDYPTGVTIVDKRGIKHDFVIEILNFSEKMLFPGVLFPNAERVYLMKCFLLQLTEKIRSLN